MVYRASRDVLRRVVRALQHSHFLAFEGGRVEPMDDPVHAVGIALGARRIFRHAFSPSRGAVIEHSIAGENQPAAVVQKVESGRVRSRGWVAGPRSSTRPHSPSFGQMRISRGLAIHVEA